MDSSTNTGYSTFEQLVRLNVGCAVILAGSGSDDKRKKPEEPSHIENIANALLSYGIPFDVRIGSAHKQVLKLQDRNRVNPHLQKIVDNYDSIPGALAYISVAGGTDALSGTLSFVSWRPTISCPPDHLNVSCLNNPSGSSNAYIGRPKDVARFVAQIFSHQNSTYKDILLKESSKKVSNLIKDDKNISQKYAKMQGRKNV